MAQEVGAAVVVVVASVVVVLAVVPIGVVASVMVVVLAVVVVVVVMVVVEVVMVGTDIVEVGTEVVIVVGFAPQEAKPQKSLPVVFTTPCVPVLGLHVPVQLYDQATQPGVSWQCR